MVKSSVEKDSEVKWVSNKSVRNSLVTFGTIQKKIKLGHGLQLIIHFSQAGRSRALTDDCHMRFYHRTDVLTILDDGLMLSELIVIPRSPRFRVLEELHTGHPGITHRKTLAQSYAYWPGIGKHIEEYVKCFEEYSLGARIPTAVPRSTWPIPKGLWKRVHIDFAGPESQHYFILIVNICSKWLDLFPAEKHYVIQNHSSG